MNNFYKREIIISCVIGDGCISKRKNTSGVKYNYSLVFTHGDSQKDYLEWKNNLIYSTGRFHSKAKIRTFTNSLNGKSFILHRSTWSNTKVLRIYYKWCYKNGIKTITDILKYIRSPLSLAILFMDDGSVFKRKRKHKDGSIYYLRPSMKLCTHSFSKGEQLLILNWMKSNFNIEGYIVIERKRNRENQPEYYTLNFNCENTVKIWELIKPYVLQIPSMQEKFNFINSYYS